MNDMSVAIIPRSDQINAEDFIAGPRTFSIEGVTITPGAEQPVSIKLAEEDRVWRPCKSMSRCLVAGWGPDAKAYIGRSVTLYRDPGVKWGGLEVGGIRIREMSDIEREMVIALTATRGSRKPFTVRPLKVAPRRQTVAEWLAALEADLAAATSSDAVEIRIASDDVRNMLAKGSDNAKAQINRLASEALKRFDEPMPDDTFPGDLPSTGEPA